MASRPSDLGPIFLNRQKQRLSNLRRGMLQIRLGQESDQAGTNEQLQGGAREYEDDAQKLSTLELDDNLSAVDDERLSNIERALQKIEEGTYGLSDSSGRPISMERLIASPEAIHTLEEQESRDAAR